MIDKIIGMHKIKYDILDTFVENNLEPSKFINIFINLHNIFAYLYIPDVIKKLEANSNKNQQFALNLLNMVAHYRHYFYSKHKLCSNIYLYYSNTQPFYNCMVSPVYKDNIFKSQKNENNIIINKYISLECEFIKDITEYIQGVYIINSGNIDSSLVPSYFINKSNSNFCNIIITKDIYEFQYVNFDKTYVLMPKKDDSVLLTKKNLFTELLKLNKSKHTQTNYINPRLYSDILAISGIPKYNIEGIPGYGFVKSYITLEKLIKNGSIINDFIYNEDNIGTIIKKPNDIPIVMKNIQLIDLITLYKKIFYDNKGNSMLLDNMIVDKYDRESLNTINETYLHGDLMLKELSDGLFYNIKNFKRVIEINC